jgi:predicted ABC-type sugar transport system permease subunit
MGNAGKKCANMKKPAAVAAGFLFQRVAQGLLVHSVKLPPPL